MRKYLAVAASILCFGTAAWLVYLLFEGDSCADAGGSFNSLVAQCFMAPGDSYVPLYRKATWIFWVIYSLVSLVAGVLVMGLLGGIVAGLRSLWFDVLQGSRQRA